MVTIKIEAKTEVELLKKVAALKLPLQAHNFKKNKQGKWFTEIVKD
jgi:hypothetical protein